MRQIGLKESVSREHYVLDSDALDLTLLLYSCHIVFPPM